MITPDEQKEIASAVVEQYRKYCKKCPDFRTGEPRLKVRPDCLCIALKERILDDIKNKKRFNKEAL